MSSEQEDLAFDNLQSAPAEKVAKKSAAKKATRKRAAKKATRKTARKATKKVARNKASAVDTFDEGSSEPSIMVPKAGGGSSK